MVKRDPKYNPIAADTLQMVLERYDVDRVIVGHTIFNEVTSLHEGKVIAVNVDNDKNRKHKRSRALLIEGNEIWLVGDQGKIKELKN